MTIATANEAKTVLAGESTELVRGAKVIVLFTLVDDKKRPDHKVLAGTSIDGYSHTKIVFIQNRNKGWLTWIETI